MNNSTSIQRLLSLWANIEEFRKKTWQWEQLNYASPPLLLPSTHSTDSVRWDFFIVLEMSGWLLMGATNLPASLPCFRPSCDSAAVLLCSDPHGQVFRWGSRESKQNRWLSVEMKSCCFCLFPTTTAVRVVNLTAGSNFYCSQSANVMSPKIDCSLWILLALLLKL